MNNSPTFHIGKIPIYGDTIFAPMAGFADVPTRMLYRSFGSALQYTEFVGADDILNGAPRVPELLDFDSSENPKVVQLFGNNANSLLEAALKVQESSPDIVDINMGCSTRRVSRRGSGVGMMKDMKLIEDTFSQLTGSLSIPVTAKLRLGWDDRQNFIEVGKLLEGLGVSALTLHPRTKEQGYGGMARWKAIAELKDSVSIPVIGNGDISTPEHIDSMLKLTGCDAVMIGRGAIGNPWLLSRIDKSSVFLKELIQHVRTHFNAMIEYYGRRGLILFRKHIKRYFERVDQLKPLSGRLVQIADPQEFYSVLDYIEDAFGGFPVGNMKRESAVKTS